VGVIAAFEGHKGRCWSTTPFGNAVERTTKLGRVCNFMGAL